MSQVNFDKNDANYIDKLNDLASQATGLPETISQVVSLRDQCQTLHDNQERLAIGDLADKHSKVDQAVIDTQAAKDHAVEAKGEALSSKTAAASSASQANTHKLAAEVAKGASEQALSQAITKRDEAEALRDETSAYADQAKNAKIAAEHAADVLTSPIYHAGDHDPSGNVAPAIPTDGRSPQYYITGDGTFDGEDYSAGDFTLWTGSKWRKKDNTEKVTSVNGKIGNVNLSLKDVVTLSGSQRPWQMKEESNDDLTIGYYDNGWKNSLRIGSGYFAFNGNAVYHAGNKPSLEALGQTNVNHYWSASNRFNDLRVNSSGGVRVDGTSGGNTLDFDVVNPTNDEFVVRFGRDSVTTEGSARYFFYKADGTADDFIVIDPADGSIRLNGDKVYHRGDKPTAADVGLGNISLISNERLRVNSSFGYVDIGANHTNTVHFYTDRLNYYFNKELSAVGKLKVYGSNTYLGATEGFIDGHEIYHAGNASNLGGGLPNLSLVANDRLKVTTKHGTLDVGPNNGSFCHFNTSATSFYFSKEIQARDRLKVYQSDSYLGITEGKINGHLIYHAGNKPSLTDLDSDAFTVRAISEPASGTYVRLAKEMRLNVWGGDRTFTFDESTFKVGDRVEVNNLYGRTINLITDEGSFWHNRAHLGSDITLTKPGTVILEKVDLTNWIIMVRPL